MLLPRSLSLRPRRLGICSHPTPNGMQKVGAAPRCYRRTTWPASRAPSASPCVSPVSQICDPRFERWQSCVGVLFPQRGPRLNSFRSGGYGSIRPPRRSLRYRQKCHLPFALLWLNVPPTEMKHLWSVKLTEDDLPAGDVLVCAIQRSTIRRLSNYRSGNSASRKALSPRAGC
jgi:hypothetical protein